MLVFVLGLAGSLGSAALLHALTTRDSGTGTGACALPQGVLSGHPLELLVRIPAHHNRDVAGALVNGSSATTGTRAPTLQCRPLVGIAGRHEEFFGRDLVVVLGVGDSRIEALADDLGNAALREGDDLAGPTVRLATDEVQDLAGLRGRDTHMAGYGPGARAPLVGLEGDGSH